jgi:hypothetical protein
MSVVVLKISFTLITEKESNGHLREALRDGFLEKEDYEEFMTEELEKSPWHSLEPGYRFVKILPFKFSS